MNITSDIFYYLNDKTIRPQMKYNALFFLIFGILFLSCSENNEQTPEPNSPSKKIGKFSGNYNRSFNDLHDLHTAAALKNGITPLTSRNEAESKKDKLTFIPDELAFYKTDKLTYSIPYLVPKAAKLLIDISINFNDSLVSKGLPPYKLILTSITRTNEDVKKLTKRNTNASQTSVHCYATTFDISWKRFHQVNPFEKEISNEKLKFILGQVLYDMRENDRCYIKHERKQACFHITVR